MKTSTSGQRCVQTETLRGVNFSLNVARRRDGKWMDEWTDGRMDRQTDGRTDGRTDGWADGWMDVCTDGGTDPLTEIRGRI